MARLYALAPSSSAICAQADLIDGIVPELKDSTKTSIKSAIAGPVTS